MTSIVITCPDCDTRYRASAESLGHDGRTVRCAKCGSTWFAPAPDVIDTLMADPDAMALEDNLCDNMAVEQSSETSAAPTPVGQIRSDDRAHSPNDAAPIVSPAPEEEPPLRAPRAPDRSLTPGAPQTAPPPAPVGADVIMRDQVDREKLVRRRRTIRFIWAVPLILVIIAALIAFFNRQEIVNRFPVTASAYQLIGLQVRAGGLEIDPPMARTVLVDGAPVIRIESVVRNLTKKAKTVPQIELTLHDIDGKGLVQWYVDPNPNRIEGQGRLVFTSEITDPPAGAVGLRYKFAEEADMVAANG